MAGYSGTPLAKKLGIKKGHRVVTVEAPPGFVDKLDGLPDRVTFHDGLVDNPDVVVAFATDRTDLQEAIDSAAGAIFPDGSIWAAWPKRASKVPTDITEDTVREIALPMGLVDNKVCAIDEVWSGLRVVWRKELRKR